MRLIATILLVGAMGLVGCNDKGSGSESKGEGTTTAKGAEAGPEAKPKKGDGGLMPDNDAISETVKREGAQASQDPASFDRATAEGVFGLFVTHMQRGEFEEAVLLADPESVGYKEMAETVTVLAEAFLSTGFPYDIRRSEKNNIDNFTHLVRRTLAIRRAGAAALDLAYVAAGRFDGFWELKLSPWDMAAGALLIEEAGGRVSTLAGRPWTPKNGDITATNGHVHKELTKELRQAKKP